MSNIQISGVVYVEGKPIGRIIDSWYEPVPYTDKPVVFLRLDNGSVIRDPRLFQSSEIKEN